MDHYGFRGMVNDWVRSYLSNRQQYVHIYNEESDILKLTCGEPQGSILGPLFFLLYINDICTVSKLTNFILFSDDTNMFYTDNTVEKINDIMNRELELLYTWFKVNKLSLNVLKNKMIFTKKRLKKDVLLRFRNVVIDRVTVLKFLGVFIDENLNWKSHIKYFETKMSKIIGILYRASQVLNQRAMLTLYHSIFLSYMTYCIEVWGNTFISNLSRLNSIHKKVVRLISNCKYNSSSIIFRKLRVLKLLDIVNFKTAEIVFNAVRNQLPKIFKNTFV